MFASPRRVHAFGSVFLAIGGVLIGACDAHGEANGLLGPLAIAAAGDGSQIFIAAYDARRLIAIDPATPDKPVWELPLPGRPTGVAVGGQPAEILVTLGEPDGKLAVVTPPGKSAGGAARLRLIDVGHTPHGPAVSPCGKYAAVCDRFHHHVRLVEIAGGKTLAKFSCEREPIAAVFIGDGSKLLVANHLPLAPADGDVVAAKVEIFEIPADLPAESVQSAAKAIALPNGSSSLKDIAVSPNGKFAVIPHILGRYHLPTTQLERGWMNTNAITIVDLTNLASLNTVLLDSVDFGAANPWGAAFSDDGRWLAVAHSGSHEVSVIDFPKVIEKLNALPPAPKAGYGGGAYGTVAGVPNDLAFLVDLRKRVRLPGVGPRGVAVAGGKVFAAEYFSDALAMIDLKPIGDKPIADSRLKAIGIPLATKQQISIERRGERLFHDAELCFQQWQSCASCHPDARVDGLNWDLLNDGIGNPKNVKSMLLAHQTPPAMASGVRGDASAAVRAGIRHIQFMVRPEEDAQAIDAYLKALAPVPSPFLVGGKLSPAAERGKAIFDDPKIGCAKCHPAPLYTDLKMHDVGSKGRYDRRDDFDTPTLIEVWRTAPYMHDGHDTTLDELFKTAGHGQYGGATQKLTDEQWNDLIEFVLSL